MKSGRLTVAVFALCLGGLFMAPFARAARADWIVTDQASLRLISATDGVKDLMHAEIGLQVRLKPGWKIYWRNPGDAGIPPQFDWAGSENVKSVRIFWPRPQAFESFGYTSWGYHDEVVYPIEVTLEKPDVPLHLNLHLFYGICEKVCIPYEKNLTLDLGAGTGKPTDDAALIRKYRQEVPTVVGSEASRVKSVQAKLEDKSRFYVYAKSDVAFAHPGLIVEGEPGVYFSVGKANLSKNGKKAVFDVTAELPDPAMSLKGQKVTVTLLDKDLSAEKRIAIE
ncbi:MAG: hypothetical protein EP348_09480 [Alphaproteobacteria bacterium]|nr:MAG: hypothetical protein EP348_09480 [Alphaproteobacteria bacterium]